MLSKVERGERKPTIAVASRIAQGLGMSLSQLLGAGTFAGAPAITRTADRLEFTDPDTGFLRELLTPAAGAAGLECARHIIPAQKSTGILPPYPGGTLKLVVLETGSLTVTIGATEQLLGPGDTLLFRADAPHAFANHGDAPTAYLLVISRTG